VPEHVLQQDETSTDTAAAAPRVAAAPPLAPTPEELRAVRRSMRFLSRHNPARRLAEAALAGERTEPELVREVLARLDRVRPMRFIGQYVALWALGNARLPDSQTRAVGECAARIAFDASRGKPRLRRDMVAEWLICALLSIVAVLSRVLLDSLVESGVWPRPVLPYPGAIAECACIMAIYARLVRLGGQQWVYRAGVVASARIGSMSSGARDAAAGSPDRDGYETLYRLLHAYAMAVRGLGWVSLLPPALRATDDSAIVLALRSAAHSSDLRALPDAEIVAKSGMTPGVRAAAERLLPILRERARQAQDAARLLRPASAPETLLRPANAPGEADPAVLLRPADGTEAMSDG
jgi:hypothetical protein